jgi:hypothetical protein
MSRRHASKPTGRAGVSVVCNSVKTATGVIVDASTTPLAITGATTAVTKVTMAMAPTVAMEMAEATTVDRGTRTQDRRRKLLRICLRIWLSRLRRMDLEMAHRQCRRSSTGTPTDHLRSSISSRGLRCRDREVIEGRLRLREDMMGMRGVGMEGTITGMEDMEVAMAVGGGIRCSFAPYCDELVDDATCKIPVRRSAA